MNKLGTYELNQIYCGNCTILMQEMPDDCIDLTVTSPPYDNLRTYQGYTFDFESIATELFRVTKRGGVVVWVVGDATVNGSETGTSFRQALGFMELGFNLETMIYEQAGTGAKGSNYYYWQSFEYMFIFAKGQPKTSNRIADVKNTAGGKRRGFSPKMASIGSRVDRPNIIAPKWSVRPNVWRYAVGQDKTGGHPAPFPEALARDHILSWSNPNDIVFDPMCGSGTVAKMCIVTDRNYIGFDISEEYVKLARKRIENTRRQLKLFGWDVARFSCDKTDNNKVDCQEHLPLLQNQILEKE